MLRKIRLPQHRCNVFIDGNKCWNLTFHMSKFHGQLSLVYKKVYNFRFLADPSPHRVFKGNFVGFVILYIVVYSKVRGGLLLL